MRSSLLRNLRIALLFAAAIAWPGLKAQGQQDGPAAANGNQVSQGIHEMQQVEDRWSDAVTKRDQYGLELALSPQFIGISASGDVTTRDQQIAKLFVKDAEPLSLAQKVISVRFLGSVAIVNGSYVMEWTRGKDPVDEKGIYSHVFEHTRAGWVCLNSQRTVVAEGGKEVAQKEKPKSKTSSAELPFHIPLIYKGPKSTQPAPEPGSEPPN